MHHNSVHACATDRTVQQPTRRGLPGASSFAGGHRRAKAARSRKQRAADSQRLGARVPAPTQAVTGIETAPDGDGVVITTSRGSVRAQKARAAELPQGRAASRL